MKYVLIPWIALGCVLSLAVAVEYHCEGQDVFPVFYGSPFIFMRTSLGSSMEYFYSIAALLADVLTWSVLLFFLDKGVELLARRVPRQKLILVPYKIILTFLLFISALTVYVSYATLGRGFDKTSNYWYWDVNREAKEWGMACEGKLVFFH